MNIWFRTASNKGRGSLVNSNASSLNTSLPVITETYRRNGGFDDDSSNGSKDSKQPQHKDQEENSSYAKILKDNSSSVNRFHKRKGTFERSNSSQQDDNDTNTIRDLSKTGKSVRFNLHNEPGSSVVHRTPIAQGSAALMRSKSSFYEGRIAQDDEEEGQKPELNKFLQFRYLKNSQSQRNEITQNSRVGMEDSYEAQYDDYSNLQHDASDVKSNSSGINPIKKKVQQVPPSLAVSRTGRSISNSRNASILAAQEREKQSWNLQTKQSVRSIEKNSVIKTTGRKQNIKQHIISIIEYCSNEVGMAIYNTVNGQIYLCQIIERLTYFRTLSTIERFYPLEIIYSSSLEHTPLMKKINDKFKNTNMRNFRRIVFDETKGYQIYNQRGNKEQYSPDNKFIAFSALNALIFYLENSYETKFNYSTLKIRWHLLEDLLIIESQTIFSLEIFLNAETKQKQSCFINNFSCLTYGGTRMLRANLLQPLSNERMIRERQELVQFFLDDKVLYNLMCEEIQKFKNFEIITAKFIQMPKEKNIKSLKSYLSAIYSISHMCLLLTNFRKKTDYFKQKKPPILGKLFDLISHPKISELQHNIESNFDEQNLKNYEGGKSVKKQNFIFLFKIERIEDDFIEVMRITYSHTMEDILRIFKIIKQKSGFDLKLLYNEFRGYYIKSNKKLNLSELSEKIEDDIIQINEHKDSINFSTSILVSLNNRLKETEKKLILLSQTLLNSIIEDIQKSIDILFDLNYEMSVVDMILSFVGFIKRYNMIKFSKPVFRKDSHEFSLSGLKTVWTMESKFKVSDEINLKVNESKKIIIFQKPPNSFQQLNLLYSIGYLTILTQIGCFVPATSFQTDIYHTLLSKIHLIQSIESNLSHFQLQLYHFKNVMDNVLHTNAKCLILFDELIKGTQYEEEVSLSLALINQLSKVSGKTFIIISDNYQINMIKKLENDSQKGEKKPESSNRKNQELKNSQKNELTLNYIQIIEEVKDHSNEVAKIMEEFNFADDFIDIFNRLSIGKQRTRLFC